MATSLTALAKLSTLPPSAYGQAISEAKSLIGQTAPEVLASSGAKLVSHTAADTGYIDSFDLDGDGKADVDRIYENDANSVLSSVHEDFFRSAEPAIFMASTDGVTTGEGDGKITHVEIEFPDGSVKAVDRNGNVTDG